MAHPRVYFSVSGPSLSLHCDDETVLVNAKLVVERALAAEVGARVSLSRTGQAQFVACEVPEADFQRAFGGVAAPVILVVARALSVAGAVLVSSGVAVAERWGSKAEVVFAWGQRGAARAGRFVACTVGLHELCVMGEVCTPSCCFCLRC